MGRRVAIGVCGGGSFAGHRALPDARALTVAVSGHLGVVIWHCYAKLCGLHGLGRWRGRGTPSCASAASAWLMARECSE